MARDGQMDVQLDGSKEGFAGRIEVIGGATGRRKWPDEVKARIAAESFVPGMRVAEIARIHGVTRWQVYSWRKLLRTGSLVLPCVDATAVPDFAEVVVEQEAPEPEPSPAAVIEIVIGDAVIRVPPEAGEDHLILAIRAAQSVAS